MEPCRLIVMRCCSVNFSIDSINVFAIQFSRNDVVYDDYFVIFRCGGDNLTVWNIIGDVESCLSNDGESLIDYASATAEEFGISNEVVAKNEIAKYIEKTYTDKIRCWLNEAKESSIYRDNAENLLDVFLEKV